MDHTPDWEVVMWLAMPYVAAYAIILAAAHLGVI